MSARAGTMTDIRSPFTLRAATPADLAVVVALIEELIVELGPIEAAEEIRSRLEGDIVTALAAAEVRVFLAEADGVVIGVGRADLLTGDPIFRLRADQRCGYVDQMYVSPAYRQAGVGRALLAACEDWFRSLGVTYCLLHAAPRAVDFYARAGYVPNREMLRRL